MQEFDNSDYERMAFQKDGTDIRYAHDLREFGLNAVIAPPVKNSRFTGADACSKAPNDGELTIAVLSIVDFPG